MRAASCRRAALLVGASLLVAMPSAAAVVSGDDPSPATILFHADDNDLTEASGIATDPLGSLFFVHQDAGDTPDILAFNRIGRVRALVHVNQPNEDWEDIASGYDPDGKPVLFIADTGNAFLARRETGQPARLEFAIIQVDQPRVDPLGPTVQINATNVRRFRFTYSDRESHDAETLLVQPHTGRYFVADKTQKPELPAYLWAGPTEPSAQRLNVFTRVGEIPVAGASGGAFSPEGDRIVIRNSTYAYIWHVSGANIARALTSAPIIILLPAQKQGEGICFTADGLSLIVNSEGRNQGVWQVGLPQQAQSKPSTERVDDNGTSAPPDKGLDRSATLISGVTLVGILLLAGLMQLRRRLRRP